MIDENYFRTNKSTLLFMIEEVLRDNFKSYNKFSLTEQNSLKMPYIQTTMTQYELIKLEHDLNT